MSTSKVIVLIKYGLSRVVYIVADSNCGISVGNLVIMLHLRYAMMDHQRDIVLEYIFFYRVKTQDGFVNMPTFYLLLLQLMNFKGIMVLSLFVVLTYIFKIFPRWRRMLFLREFCQKKLNYYVCFR